MVAAMTTTPWIPSHHPASTVAAPHLDAAATRGVPAGRLDAEWAHLRTSRRALRTARSWASTPPAIRWRTVVVDLTRPRPDPPGHPA